MWLDASPAGCHAQELLIVKSVADLAQDFQLIQSLIHEGMTMKLLMLECQQPIHHPHSVRMSHKMVDSML